MKYALLIALLALNACTFDLGSRGRVRSAQDAPYAGCGAIDREHSIATLGAGILGGLAGAGGLTSIPVKDDDVKAGLVTGSAVSGIGAMTMGLWAQERAERYQSKCAK